MENIIGDLQRLGREGISAQKVGSDAFTGSDVLTPVNTLTTPAPTLDHLSESRRLLAVLRPEVVTQKLAETNMTADQERGITERLTIRCAANHTRELWLSEVAAGAAVCATCALPKYVSTVRAAAERQLGPLYVTTAPAPEPRTTYFATKCGGFGIAVSRDAVHGRAELVSLSPSDAAATVTQPRTILVYLRPGRGHIMKHLIDAAAKFDKPLPRPPPPLPQRGRLPVSVDMAEAAAAAPLKQRMQMSVVYDDSLCFERNVAL